MVGASDSNGLRVAGGAVVPGAVVALFSGKGGHSSGIGIVGIATSFPCDLCASRISSFKLLFC